MSLALVQTVQAQVWRSIGPNRLVPTDSADNFAGRVAAIAIDPKDPNHWLAGIGTGGVWGTVNSGSDWFPLTDGQPTLATGAVAFAPSDSTIVYVGTGEANLDVQGAQAGLGILKSRDGGATWTLLAASTFARSSVSSVHVHPQNPDIVIVSTTRGGAGRDLLGIMPAPPPLGVFKSGDGGSTWTRTLTGQVTALEVDPNNFNNQYAAIGADIQTPGVVEGLYRSTDTGQTWTRIPGPWGVSTGRIALALAPSDSNVLYVSVQASPTPAAANLLRGNGTLLGLFRSDAAWGAAPTWISVPTGATGSAGYCSSKCSYAHVLSVDPSDPQTLFVGGVLLWKCQSCGATPIWSQVFPGSDFHSLVWSGNRLIVGNDHGVLLTLDRGQSWRRQNGRMEAPFSTIQFYSGALHPTDPNFILGGTQDNLGIRWTGGVVWDRLYTSTQGDFCEGEIAISSAHPLTDWMCEFPGAKINRTTNGLQSWIPADGGIDHRGQAFLTPVRKCPSNDDVFLTGTHRLWRTNTFFSAATPAWSANGPEHPSPAVQGSPGMILAIEFAAADPTCNTYAYGNRGGEIQLTTDGGATWRDLDPGRTLPSRPVNWLAFDPANRNILYAAFSSFDIATPAKPGHLFRTTNGMSASPAWINVGPPDDQPHNVIAIDPRTNAIFVGTDAGIWYTADSGAGWQRFGPADGLPNAPVYDLKINPTTDRTVAFTYGRGAFLLDRTAVPASDVQSPSPQHPSRRQP